MIGRRRHLGVAVGQRLVVAAEVEAAGGARRVRRVEQFALPEDLSWEEPGKVGELLGAWLRKSGLARDAVVGISARWLVTARHELPPAEREALVGLLRLAAERAFSLPREQLLCDYASAPPENTAGEALLVGARRERVEAAIEAVRAGGCRVRAVTATAAVLAHVGSPLPDSVTARLEDDGAEITLTRSASLRAIRHVAFSPEDTDPTRALHLGIRSVLANVPSAIEQVRLYGSSALNEASVSGLCVRLGLEPERDPPLPVEGLEEAAAQAELPAGRVVPAVALGLAGFERTLIPFDLSEPRLARRPERRWSRVAGWAAFVVVVLLAALGALALDRRAISREVAELRARRQSVEPSLESARRLVETVSTARGWYDQRPPFLDCLRAITLAFPEEGRSMWAASLAVQEDMRGVLSGRATSDQPVLDVLENLKASGQFNDVKLLYIRETRGAGGEIAFAITYTYSGAE